MEVSNLTENKAVKRKAKENVLSTTYKKKVKGSNKPFRPGFGEEKFDETDYYIENGLRKVYPYIFTYTSYCKGRWAGEKLMDIYAREFRAHPREEYVKAVLSGSVTVNGKMVGTDYVLRDNDLIANKVHRHEIPVLAAPLKIIHQSDDLVIIDKPPSIPVHPCGRYRHNSIAFILGKEYNLKNLNILHRLDRLTSGLLMFGLKADRVKTMMDQIRERQVSKEYVCRVDGNFPDQPVCCVEPIEVISHKIGVCVVSPSGKGCKTEFSKLSYNGKSSVVMCRPLTGRMHQIRIHLQYLGHPIVNDPLYNHEVFGPNKGKGGDLGKSREQLLEDLIKVHTAENWLNEEESSSGTSNDSDQTKYDKLVGEKKDENEDTSGQQATIAEENKNIECAGSTSLTCGITSSLKHYTENDKQYEKLKKQYVFDPKKITYDPNCYDCQRKYKDPKPSDLIMFLHALKYKGLDWEFETEMPAWAKDDWTES
ncbi:RNA pseudouridylate synthase domain-containing protein 2-like isoform X2 [Limulus polyphemus]|nr:RNA pseudouridylate synthase domain-containing protein 2-like isoform X2 [Limulus polyphemus]XP_013773916.1 RNA pseudouridylate synthase domain-containing protein 2-like isoform X2 [Limulus polyphemus]